MSQGTVSSLLDVDRTDHVRGSRDGRITVIEYGGSFVFNDVPSIFASPATKP